MKKDMAKEKGALVVVESPAKARTIGKYLGKNFTVKATVGHLRDLPQRELGVDVDNGFAPKYVTIRGKGKTLARVSDPGLKRTFGNIRDALARYTIGNNSYTPDETMIYDWQSLRRLVNRYSKQPLPATEAEAGFSFVRYTAEVDDYTLLVELHEPEDGVKRVEVTPYGVDRVG